MVISLSGEPFTVKVPLSYSRSSAATSSWCATIWRALSMILSAAKVRATPPTGRLRLP